jgi:hypothetical protein
MLVNVRQAAEMLGVHPRTLARWLDKGSPDIALPPVLTVGNVRYFSRDALVAWEHQKLGFAHNSD